MYTRNSLEAIISRFESADITSVLEFEQLLKVLRLTHEMLSVHLDLDAFDLTFTEADETNSGSGRILAHISAEITGNFASQFSYNSVTDRFLRTPLELAPLKKRPSSKQHKQEFLFGNKVFRKA
jgi:cytoplasmic FMR1 interacting protein